MTVDGPRKKLVYRIVKLIKSHPRLINLLFQEPVPVKEMACRVMVLVFLFHIVGLIREGEGGL